MRNTLVMAFSVPRELEKAIQKHARAEHRTISEYLREAVRQYMTLREFEATRRAVTARLKRKGLKAKDVEEIVADLRK